MKFFNVIMALIIAVAIVSPMAMAADTQIAAPVQIGGIGNDQTTTNIDDSTNMDITAGQIGVGNNMELTNNHIVDNRVSSSSITNMIIPAKAKASYYGFDTGTVLTQIMSIYEGQVIVAMNDAGYSKQLISEPGDKYTYNIKSSVPVLAYVINANDAQKAEWDSNCAPVYDPIAHKFNVGNIDKIYIGKYRSPLQQFEVTIPKDGKGRYALVIDTRVSHAMNGQLTKISDDSVDVIYSIEKVMAGDPADFAEVRDVIGTSSMYPILSNGMANTA